MQENLKVEVTQLVDLKKLRAMRAFKRLTQKQLEERLSISSYSAKERGDLFFNLIDCVALGLFYKLTPEQFNEIFLRGKLQDARQGHITVGDFMR